MTTSKEFHRQMDQSFKKLGSKAKLCDIIGTDENGEETSKHATTFRLEGVNDESVSKCIDREIKENHLKIHEAVNGLRESINRF